MGFNVMEDVGYDKRHLIVSGLMGAFERIWEDQWSARMAYILQNVLLALLEYPGATLLDVNRMLTNKTFREVVVDKITDPIVKAFWTEEFASFTDRYTAEATPAIQNKIGQFVANPLIRHIIGQPTSSFDLRKIMDEKKIFIVNLSKGRMGETNASLLGSMLTVKIYLAAMSRADEPAAVMARLPRFYFYVDEFQSMMNQAFADILSESRKYKLALTLANQYIEQMEETVRDAVFGNVGTLIVFRVGPFDAEVLKTVFEPTFLAEDLVGLGLGQIYLTLMIDGVGSPPFSAETIPPIEAPNISYRDDVVTASRAQYGRLLADVQANINFKQTEFAAPPKEKKDKRDGPRPAGDRSSNGWNAAPQGGTTPREKLMQTAAPTPSAPIVIAQSVHHVQNVQHIQNVQNIHPAAKAEDPRSELQTRIQEIRRDGPRPGAVRPQGHINPNAGRSSADSRDKREDMHAKREALENEHRSSLREAIEAAKGKRDEAANQQKVHVPERSPLDALREKNAKRQDAPPRYEPRPATPPKPATHTSANAPHTRRVHETHQMPDRPEIKDTVSDTDRPHTGNQAHSAGTHTKPEEKQHTESHKKETTSESHVHHTIHHEHEHHQAEVSHRQLMRVLNGRDRDHDDL